MPTLLLRAIITGFGYKVGTELARWAIDRFGKGGAKKAEAAQTEQEVQDGLPVEPDKVDPPPVDPPPVEAPPVEAGPTPPTPRGSGSASPAS